jgi:hypothetical protein
MRRIVLAAGALAIAVATLTLAACASSADVPNDPSTTAVLDTVVGVVDAAPGCPGPARLDSPCPARPLPGAVIDILRNGQRLRIVTNESGQFRVPLEPGIYQFTAHNVGGYQSQTTRVVVVPATQPVELTVDSGMR